MPPGRGFFGLAFWIALAGLTPTGLLLAATVAVVCVGAPGTGPTALAVRRCRIGYFGARGAAVADLGDAGSVVG